METNSDKQILILLLPPFFNKEKLENEKYNFLNLNEIVKEDLSFGFSGRFEVSKENILSLFEEISKHDFSNHTVKKIKDLANNSSKKTILVNYPNNVEQFEVLNSKLLEEKISISKVVVSNFETFETFEKLSLSFFICPLCFNSFEKSSCLSEEKNVLICPLDKNRVSNLLSQKFNKAFSEHYLVKSLGFAQKLSSVNEQKGDFLKIDILPLIISEIDDFESSLVDKISGIF